jgi:2-keto-3-deoxy-L-arabinonate dehydratase
MQLPSPWAGEIHGIVPVIPTPFDERDELDIESIHPLIDFAASTGVTAVCLPAYGSEFYKLSEAERMALIGAAIDAARGRVKIIAQSNHPSAKLAAEIARRNAGLGADAISFALPRMFSLAESDLLRYAEKVARSVTVPVLVQDFNPGGPSVGASFAQKLKQAAPNFRFLKLEEPLMGPKVQAIREATRDGVGVLEGWGGMYLLELLPAGICGVMPGLAMCDLFQLLVSRAAVGDAPGATALFTRMLPQIIYSLQNMELFHHCEKRLLVARGILAAARVRDATLSLDSGAVDYIEFLNREILAAAAEASLTTART